MRPPGDAASMVCVASMLIGEAVVRLVGGPDDGPDVGLLFVVVDLVVVDDGVVVLGGGDLRV